MVTIAKDFLASYEAGLILAGQNEEGLPEWIGTESMWKKRQEILEGLEGRAWMKHYLKLLQ